jgi:hypothetical protein
MAKAVKEKVVKPKSKSVKAIKPKEIKVNNFTINGNFVHIKVGNEILPASDNEIASIEEKISEIIESNNIECIVFVTHHAVEINVY